jgi:hypothetical protein
MVSPSPQSPAGAEVVGDAGVAVVATVVVVEDPAGGDAVQADNARTSTARHRFLMEMKRRLPVGGSPPVSRGIFKP